MKKKHSTPPPPVPSHIFWVTNASRFYLRTIAGSLIAHNTRTHTRNSAQFRAIQRNGIPIGSPTHIT